MEEKLRKKLKAAGYSDEELNKAVADAIRTAKALPTIKAEGSATGKITWVIRYPQGYEDREEQETIELKVAAPEIMIVAVDDMQQIVDQNDPTIKIYFEVNRKVIIDKRDDTRRSLKDRGMPSKACTVVFKDETGKLRVGMFYVSVTNLKALDMLAKKVKALAGNFSGTTINVTTRITQDGVRKWILYDYELADPPNEEWIDKFIEALEEVKERNRIYASDAISRREETPSEAPGMGEDM